MLNSGFLAMCDRVISACSFQDMMQHKNKLSKAKQRNYKGGYSLSQNTLYLLETKNAYINGEITEEEAKAVFLRQNVCGNQI